MVCVPAPTCKAALSEATRLWQGRNRLSDGICPNAEHTSANPTSDHEKGNAFDLTHDPANGVDCQRLADLLVARRDPRVKYVIFNRRIWNPAEGWHRYTGTNPHTHHMHVSIYARVRDDIRSWWQPTKQEATTMAGDGLVKRVYLPDMSGGYAITVDGGVYPWGTAHPYADQGGAKFPDGSPATNAYGRTSSPVVDLHCTDSGYTLEEKNGGYFRFGPGAPSDFPSLHGQIRYSE